MNDNNSIVDTQMNHLLGVVDEYREKQCNKLLEEANAQAQAIIRKAYQESRQRLHREIQQGRENGRQAIASAEAQMLTRQRHLRQANDKVMLDRAWGKLQQHLLQVWQTDSLRSTWLDNILQAARTTLNTGTWHIEHPADMSDKELDQLSAAIQQYTGNEPAQEKDNTLSAGVRLCCDGACVDGTLAGMMSYRDFIESMLLYELNQQLQTQGQEK
jgi:hypothetical protein